MSANKSTYVTLLFLVLLAVVYFLSANALPEAQDSNTLDSGYFPKLLSVLLIIFCLISFFQTRKKEDKKIPLPNVKTILITIGITILYFLSWTGLGYFYVNTFLYLFILFTFYKPSKKFIWIHVVVALVMTLAIYALFGILLAIRF